MSVLARQTTLDEAVRELVDRGCTEPTAIAASLSEQYGQPWLLRQLVNVIARIAAGGFATIPAHREANQRRDPGVSRVQVAAVSQDVFGSSVWVQNRGWVTLGELSAHDCRVVAAQYGRLAQAAERHRDWFLSAAELVEREGALCLSEVRSLLAPPLDRIAVEATVGS